jgi:hypothetical protein
LVARGSEEAGIDPVYSLVSLDLKPFFIINSNYYQENYIVYIFTPTLTLPLPRYKPAGSSRGGGRGGGKQFYALLSILQMFKDHVR